MHECSNAFGEEYPETFAALINLIFAYNKTKQIDKAIELVEKAFDIEQNENNKMAFCKEAYGQTVLNDSKKH